MPGNQVTIDGLRIHYHHAGERGSPVILLHGGGIDSARLSWALALPALAESHRVFAPDMPGYGESDRPPQFAHTIESYARIVIAFMDALGIAQASVCGVSMGGALTLHLGLTCPQRVLRLVPVSSYGLQRKAPAHALSYGFVRLPFLTRLMYAALRRNRAWTRASLASIFADASRISDELVNDVFDEIHRPATGEAFMAFQKHEMLPHGLRASYLDRLHEIKAPTLFVHGDRDRLVPIAWAREASRRLAGSQLQVMTDCGHWPQRELPETFHAIITEFLRD